MRSELAYVQRIEEYYSPSMCQMSYLWLGPKKNLVLGGATSDRIFNEGMGV